MARLSFVVTGSLRSLEIERVLQINRSSSSDRGIQRFAAPKILALLALPARRTALFQTDCNYAPFQNPGILDEKIVFVAASNNPIRSPDTSLPRMLAECDALQDVRPATGKNATQHRASISLHAGKSWSVQSPTACRQPTATTLRPAAASRIMPAGHATAGNLAVNLEIVGEYELGPLLGSGTVGEVYRARHRETGQAAVVKLLQAATAGEPEVQRRFVREVAIAEKLAHPNIVRHYDCGLCDDQIYFAMELVECGTLKDVLRNRGTLSWRETVACAMQVCEALDHAHGLGIIHRDLKPANLFLAADGRVKIGDFGLARDLNRVRLTVEGQTVGTCRYMPPEQITGEEELTGAVDLYALGCLMYEMLVGRPPFDGNTIIQIFEAHLYNEPTPPATLIGDCPQDLSALVLLLLEKSPQDRPVSAAEVQTALADILYGRPMRLPAREGKQRVVEARAMEESVLPIRAVQLSEDSWIARPSRSTKFWLAAAALLAAVVAIGIGFAAW